MVKFHIDKSSKEYAKMIELTKRAALSNADGLAAREAIAAFVGPVIDQVLDQEATHRAFYTKFGYSFGDAPEIPLDLFDGNEEGLFDVWSTSIPGGLATNHVYGGDVFRMTTFRYDSALSMLRRTAEKGRFDVMVKGIERLAQEIMVKEKQQAWSTMLAALGGARTNGSPHIIDAKTPNVFQPQDLNSLKTKVDRLRNSWLGGTENDSPGSGVSHFVISPEIMEQIRGWAYEPVNTRAGSVDTSGATAIPLTDQIRNSIFQNSGLAEIPGLGSFIKLKEFGVGQSYNSLFDESYTSGAGEPEFDPADDEIVLGVDLSLPGGVQATAEDSERGSEFVMEEDDQFTKRDGKIGWYGGLETGFAWMDNKTLSGIVV